MRLHQHSTSEVPAPEQVAADDAATPQRDEGSVLILVSRVPRRRRTHRRPVDELRDVGPEGQLGAQRQDQARRGGQSGPRVALSDPVSLYEQCGNGGPNTPIRLASPQVAGPVRHDELLLRRLRDGAVGRREALGPGRDAGRPGAAHATEGQHLRAAQPEQRAGLGRRRGAHHHRPARSGCRTCRVHALEPPRRRAGFAMPAGFPTCKVFFPGTYTDPITINGPTYFTSGIYYFENEIKFIGGASAVIGLGAEAGVLRRPGSGVLRHQCARHPQHQRPRRHVRVRQRRAPDRRQHRRRHHRRALQPALRPARRRRRGPIGRRVDRQRQRQAHGRRRRTAQRAERATTRRCRSSAAPARWWPPARTTCPPRSPSRRWWHLPPRGRRS